MQRLEESTAHGQRRGNSRGCQEAEIAKSIVFVADGDPVVCVASGATGSTSTSLPTRSTAPRCARRAPTRCARPPGFAVGGVPPFGHDLPVIVDEALLDHERVWAAGGDPHSLFAVDPRELARCTHARVARVGADADG